MPLLLFAGHYPPDQTPAAHYLQDITHAIAGAYPVEVFSGSAGSENLPPTANVKVRQIGFATPARLSLRKRLLGMIRLSANAFLAAFRHAGPQSPVLVVTAPFLLPYFTVLAARLRRARCALILYDLYPDALVVAGVSRQNSFTVWAVRLLNRAMFRQLDFVVTIGRDMEARLIAYPGFKREKIAYIPNWAVATPGFRPTDIENRFRQPIQDRFVVGMCGNLGFTHDPMTPLNAAAQLAGDQRIHFLFSGWGTGWTKLVDAQKSMQLPNVTLVERVPQEELSDMLAAADAWILPYRRGMLGISVPSRTYNILALGRPIIVLSEPMAEQSRVAVEEDVGWICQPEDTNALVTLLKKIAADPRSATEKGRNAVAAVQSRYTLSVAARRYRELASELLAPSRRG